MVLVSGNFPSAVGHPGGIPQPGPQPDENAVLVRLTRALKMDAPFPITGDVGQWLWLSPEAAAFVVDGKDGVYHQAR
jgi:hypothetical protein